MKKIATFARGVRVRTALCCALAGLFGACGGEVPDNFGRQQLAMAADVTAVDGAAANGGQAPAPLAQAAPDTAADAATASSASAAAVATDARDASRTPAVQPSDAMPIPPAVAAANGMDSKGQAGTGEQLPERVGYEGDPLAPETQAPGEGGAAAAAAAGQQAAVAGQGVPQG